MTSWLGTDVGAIDAAWLANQVFVQGTAVLLVALASARLLRSASPAARHGVWVLALLALLLAPLLAIPEAAPAAPRTTTVQPEAGSPVPPVSIVPERSRPAPVRPSPRERIPTLPAPPEGWLWVWSAGAVVLLLRLRRQVRLAEALERGSAEAPPALRAGLESMRLRLCPGRAVEVRMHPSIRVPLIVGHRRAVILLPEGAHAWPAARLDSALRHELAHLVRHDYALHALGGVVLALYWPNPLSWLAGRRLEREREGACDDRVLGWGTPAAEYALHLVEVARDARARRWGAAAAFAGRAGVKERVSSILSASRPRPWGRARWALASMVAALLTVVVSGFQGILPTREARRADALSRLAAPNPADRRVGAWMLGELESTPDVPALEAALADASAAVRRTAAWALGEVKDPTSGPALVRALEDPDGRVRELAALALGELEDPAGVQALVEAAERDEALRAPVAWALTQIGGPALARDHGLVGEGEPTPHMELWTGGSPLVPQPAAGALDEWLAGLAAEAPETRREAALALGRLGSEDAVDALLDAVDDPSGAVRAAAVWALDEINPSR